MKRPTSAQLTWLQRIADGHVCEVSGRRAWYIGEPHVVPEPVVTALDAAGWFEWRRDRIAVLTAAGREVLG